MIPTGPGQTRPRLVLELEKERDPWSCDWGLWYRKGKSPGDCTTKEKDLTGTGEEQTNQGKVGNPESLRRIGTGWIDTGGGGVIN